METIKNDYLSVKIFSLGAEMQSIQDNEGHEYLWQADPTKWARHSPILFPLVCGLWQDTYRLDGKEYHMKRHGFARDTNFRLIAQGDSQVVYALTDTEKTFEVYPFHFNLAVSYKLVKNQIHVVWHVENTDRRDIYFQIGGHPAFNVPDLADDEPLRGRLRLDNPEPARVFGNDHGCLVPGYHPVETKDGILEFTDDTFKDDALIFDHSQLHRVALLDKTDKPVVTVDFKSPAVGIWSPAKNAHFVCIEPWYGVHDWSGYTGDFRDRYLMNKLMPGASFMSEYVITIK